MESNKDYISYSQYALFKSSPKSYYNRYVLGKVPPSTKYQTFGKELMKNLEFANLEGLPDILKFAISKGNIEQEIKVKSNIVKGKNLFGIIDTISDDYSSFCEIKTGKHPWNKIDVQKNEQILFYALMILLKFGVIPTATLVWVETEEDEDGILGYTGKVKTFTRKFKLSELVKFEKKLGQTVEDIKNYVFDMKDIEEDKDAKLLELLSAKKDIDEKIDLIKSEIMLEMQEFGNKYAESENFNYTLAVRTSYEHSDTLKETIKEVNEKVANLKKIEIQEGVAKPKTTEYLLIKPKK